MTENTKEEIHAVLTLLKNVLIKNEVSMGVSGNDLIFFDTSEYVVNKKFNGMKVTMSDLVK